MEQGYKVNEIEEMDLNHFLRLINKSKKTPAKGRKRKEEVMSAEDFYNSI
jgi:hypothetical protein